MIKPNNLKTGDKVAIVSLSSGLAGEEKFKHRYELGKKRLEEDFGLEIITMPNALKGLKFNYENPEARAKDLMDAFKDKSIKGIISNIGGDDTIRLLPYIDYDVIKNNPKVFLGYSDTTVNHFMMYKAGLQSFYGPCVLCDFAENVEMHEYTKKYVQEVLFKGNKNIEITSSPYWTSELLGWHIAENDNTKRKLEKEERGYEVLQGTGVVEGELLGGCIDTFPGIIGTEIWPDKEEWRGKILFIETSEEHLKPDRVKRILRSLHSQGILEVINGIIIGKPKDETYYEEYKEMYKEFFEIEAERTDLPIMYNLNFGHASPLCILPYGLRVRVDCDNKKVILLEEAVITA